MGEIKLDLAPYGHECDTCQNANYRRPGMSEPRFTCAIYALTIGAGYRQPSYLCPDCLDLLRATLGVGNIQRTYDAATIATNEARGFRVLPSITDRNREGSL